MYYIAFPRVKVYNLRAGRGRAEARPRTTEGGPKQNRRQGVRCKLPGGRRIPSPQAPFQIKEKTCTRLSQTGASSSLIWNYHIKLQICPKETPMCSLRTPNHFSELKICSPQTRQHAPQRRQGVRQRRQPAKFRQPPFPPRLLSRTGSISRDRFGIWGP